MKGILVAKREGDDWKILSKYPLTSFGSERKLLEEVSSAHLLTGIDFKVALLKEERSIIRYASRYFKHKGEEYIFIVLLDEDEDAEFYNEHLKSLAERVLKIIGKTDKVLNELQKFYKSFSRTVISENVLQHLKNMGIKSILAIIERGGEISVVFSKTFQPMACREQIEDRSFLKELYLNPTSEPLTIMNEQISVKKKENLEVIIVASRSTPRAILEELLNIALSGKDIEIAIAENVKKLRSKFELLKQFPEIEKLRLPTVSFSIAVVGKSGTGKTAIMKALIGERVEDWITDSSDLLTIFFTYSGETNELESVNVSFYEFNERIAEFVSYVKFDAGIVVFDLSDRDSWIQVPYWIEMLRKRNAEIKIFLVGNKNDVKQRQVAREEILALVKEKRVKYVEVSAKTKFGISTLFVGLLSNLEIEPPSEPPLAVYEHGIVKRIFS